MAISYVNKQLSTDAGPRSSPWTISVNIGTRTNGLLVVMTTGYVTGNYFNPHTITYGGESLTKAAGTSGVPQYADVWYLYDPPDGTNDLVITFTVSSSGQWFYAAAMAVWFDGVTTSPLDDAHSNVTSNEDITVTIVPTQNNEMLINMEFSEYGTVPDLGEGEIAIQSYDWGPMVTAASYAIQTTAITQYLNWVALEVCNSGIAGASFKEFSGSGGLISGSTVWGHSTGATETNIRTFLNNWSGTASASGSGDAEQLVFNVGNTAISEMVIIPSGSSVTLLQNEYSTGDNIYLRYRHGISQGACEAASWNDYSGSFPSLGYVQLKLEALS